MDGRMNRNNNKMFFAFSAFIFCCFSSTTADLFTSSADLQRLTYAEKDIPNLISNYIQLESERLEHLKRFGSHAMLT